MSDVLLHLIDSFDFVHFPFLNGSYNEKQDLACNSSELSGAWNTHNTRYIEQDSNTNLGDQTVMVPNALLSGVIEHKTCVMSTFARFDLGKK
jgi:hypothetical protein